MTYIDEDIEHNKIHRSQALKKKKQDKSKRDKKIKDPTRYHGRDHHRFNGIDLTRITHLRECDGVFDV